jgi:Domain of unknown function (DUF4136)
MSTRISHPKRGPRARLRLAVVTVTAVLGACGPNVHVRTTAAPEASLLAGRRTFSIVEAGKETNGNGNGYGIHDPMIENSITSQALHDQIRAAFEARGYRYVSDNADFVLSYNATIAPILDIRTYNYGRHGYYGYRSYYYDGYYDGCCVNDGFGYAVGTYDRGTVIIDAIDPGSRKLLWRGQGTAGTYTEPKRFLKELRHAVRAVAKKFPVGRAGVPLTASR